MTLLNNLIDYKKWCEYLNFLVKKRRYKEHEIQAVNTIINTNKYKDFTTSYIFKLIAVSELDTVFVSKFQTNEKRVVFKTNNELDIILKFIVFCMRDFDYIFEDNLYSYRHSNNVKNAINKIKKSKNTELYSLKIDIHSYFISMKKELIISKIKSIFPNDIDFIEFNKLILNMKPKIDIPTGGMPGLAISCFYANIYLMSLDKLAKDYCFEYYRYSDDILIKCESSEIEIIETFLNRNLFENGLVINEKKRNLFMPGEPIDFLGFCILTDKIVDISESSIKKIKHKIKHFCTKIKKRIHYGEISRDEGIKIAIEKYNKKFFFLDYGEISWSLWYFPTITTSDSLKIVDSYLQEEIRSVYTGHYKKNNKEKVPYIFLKENGYRTLVNEYFKYILSEK